MNCGLCPLDLYQRGSHLAQKDKSGSITGHTWDKNIICWFDLTKSCWQFGVQCLIL
ncbi:MAG: hypothetical protein KME05_09855 [Gloeocapsa sp. UFS-A4-WI-NPMV-4B04]|nr:hypothetical protein [Gloeocapsa sp. UFS-A4-WI-NPMV-4B04]